jgi:hypothetical protein
MEAQWFNVAEQAFAQYSFAKKLWWSESEGGALIVDKEKPP